MTTETSSSQNVGGSSNLRDSSSSSSGPNGRSRSPSLDLDTSALAALDSFRASKAAEEAKLIKYTAGSQQRSKLKKKGHENASASASTAPTEGTRNASTSSSRKQKNKASQAKLTPEQERLEAEKAEAALLAEIEAIADLERLNGIAPDSADSMLSDLSTLTNRLNTNDDAESTDGEGSQPSSRRHARDEDDDDDDAHREGEERSRFLDVDTFRTTFGESWQLSQFWYSAKFVSELSTYIHGLLSKGFESEVDSNKKVAFLCCPTAWVGFVHQYPELAKQAYFFEVDKRFRALSQKSYVYYNLHEPLKLPSELQHQFDIIISDPPFLNKDTHEKVATTAKWLAKDEPKFLLITGQSIADQATQMYGQHVEFDFLEDLVVEHHGLANAFGVWASR